MPSEGALRDPLDGVGDLLDRMHGWHKAATFTAILILVCHLTKMAHFVPCHKEITAEDIADIFIDNCYKLHGAPKVIVSDMDPW